jgi:predicted glutamine amidotransferase
MCELMGICANLEVNSRFSFKEMKIRGGRSGPHKDGWGIGIYAGASSRVIKEPKPAFVSKKAKEIESGDENLTSKIFVCHIRRAASSCRCIKNTQPFKGRLFDQDWLFVHNGGDGLARYYNSHNKKVSGCFNPEGDTGSERGFVLILNALKEKNAKDIADQRNIIKTLADDIARSGAEFNIIMSNSEYLFCYYSGYNSLFYVKRSYEDDKHLILIDAGDRVDIPEMKNPGEKAIIVATKQFTEGENWKPFSTGELKIFKNGCVF